MANPTNVGSLKSDLLDLVDQASKVAIGAEALFEAVAGLREHPGLAWIADHLVDQAKELSEMAKTLHEVEFAKKTPTIPLGMAAE